MLHVRNVACRDTHTYTRTHKLRNTQSQNSHITYITMCLYVYTYIYYTWSEYVYRQLYIMRVCACVINFMSRLCRSMYVYLCLSLSISHLSLSISICFYLSLSISINLYLSLSICVILCVCVTSK